MSPEIHRVLAIETSCDDTSVSIVEDGGFVRAVVSANQNLAHEVFGGIVPEIASRNHTFNLLPIIEVCLEQAGLSLQDLDGIAVTNRPGLIGSLLVGLVTAKSLSLVTGKPFIGVNHLEGHLLAPFLRDDRYAPPADFAYPYVALAISGGHTSLYRIDGVGEYQVLGQTIDDAAGECFDKFGKMLGLGFPGGVRVDRAARVGDGRKFQFPRPMKGEDHLSFSFSGMKTAAQRMLAQLSTEESARLTEQARALLEGAEPVAGVLSDLCASFQDAMVDVLLDRLAKAVREHGVSRAVLTGGVSANSRLRERAEAWAVSEGVRLVVPPIRYCTDNAAMIGYAGLLRLQRGETSSQELGPEARAPLGVAPMPENLPAWLVKARQGPGKKEGKT